MSCSLTKELRGDFKGENGDIMFYDTPISEGHKKRMEKMFKETDAKFKRIEWEAFLVVFVGFIIPVAFVVAAGVIIIVKSIW